MKTKLYRSITLRALSMLLIGALVVIFPTDATVYLVISIGLLFLIPGFVSIITYFRNKRKIAKANKLAQQQEGQNNTDATKKNQIVYFPIIGLGSILFGIILVSFPTAFKEVLIYLLGAFLIIAALAQAFNMYKLSKTYKVSFVPYVISALIGIAGIVVIMLNYSQAPVDVNDGTGEEPSSVASIVFGAACVVYGISEIVYALYFRKPELKDSTDDDKQQ